MSTAIATRESGASAIHDDMSLKELGAILAGSGFFKDTRDAAQACVKVLFGRELGVGPVTAMTGIHIIEGRPQVGAHLIAAAIKRSGRYDYRVARHDSEGCELVFFQNSEEIGRYSYTMEDARAAGLAGRGNWSKHPRSMLFARAIGQGYRTHCPDVFSMAVYAEGEIETEQVEIIREPAPSAPTSQPTPPPAPKVEPPRKPAAPESSITTDTTIGPEWAAVLGDALAVKLRGLALHDRTCNGALVGVQKRVAAGELHVDDHIAECLRVAMQCARRRLMGEIKGLGIDADIYGSIRAKLNLPGPLNELEPWDVQRVRDSLERRAKKLEAAPPPAPPAEAAPTKDVQKAREDDWRGNKREAEDRQAREIERLTSAITAFVEGDPDQGAAWATLCKLAKVPTEPRDLGRRSLADLTMLHHHLPGARDEREVDVTAKAERGAA